MGGRGVGEGGLAGDERAAERLIEAVGGGSSRSGLLAAGVPVRRLEAQTEAEEGRLAGAVGEAEVDGGGAVGAGAGGLEVERDASHGRGGMGPRW